MPAEVTYSPLQVYSTLYKNEKNHFMTDNTVSEFVEPERYPFPGYVMLEITELEDNKIQIALVDNKNNDVLDCITVYIWRNASRFDWLKFYCDQFKNSLKNSGVI